MRLEVNGNTITDRSPYYFLILGKDRNVAFMRNCISTILEDYGDYGDCIESGFDYKAPVYTFGIPDNALQLHDQPTFKHYDTRYSDTCKITLNLDLGDYRWLITNEEVLRENLAAKSCYGSTISIGKVAINDVYLLYRNTWLSRVISVYNSELFQFYIGVLHRMLTI